MGGMLPPGPGMPPMMPGVPPGNVSTHFHITALMCITNLKWQFSKLKFVNMVKHHCGDFSLVPWYNEFVLFVTGMPPPVAHRPGITHMAQVPPAANMLTRPAVPAATVPSAQPDVTKPLFPIAGQVKSSWNLVRLLNLPQHSNMGSKLSGMFE